MIKSITVTNYLGDSIKLELTRPDKTGFIVKSITGLGAPKANINTTESATMDGGMFNSSRLSQRNIVVNLAFMQTAKESIEQIRHKSYRYFPIKKWVTLVFETNVRVSTIKGYVESNEPDIFSNNEATSISILCPDPYFRSQNINETVFSGVDPLFEFPFENNSLTEPVMELSSLEVKSEQVVVYKGDSEVGIIINIHAIGDASDLEIYNTLTHEKMAIDTTKLAELTGNGIVANDTIIINTNKGEKSIHLIRDGVTTNILNCLTKDSDWFTLTKGDNIFAYKVSSEGSSSGANLQFCVSNKIIYDGV